MRSLLALLAAPLVWPCTCISYEPKQACELISTVPVIFRGRVIDHNYDPHHGSSQWNVYRVRVEEPFQGIPNGAKEVFVTGGLACPSDLPTDGDVLVYARASRSFVPFAEINERVQKWKGRDGTGKPFPATWAQLGRLPVFELLPFCTPSRLIVPNDPNLAFLRQRAAGKQVSGFLEGWIAQSSPTITPSYAERVPLPGATVTLTGTAGPRRVASGPDGRYRIDGLTPGNYTVTIEKPGYQTARDPTTFTLAHAACHVERTTLQASATLSGVVLGQNGKPARTVRVELGQLGDDGKARFIPYYFTETDAQGRFQFQNVPAGIRIVAGLNINGAPSKREPYDQAFAPGNSPLAKARVYELIPDQQVTGVELRVPPALPFGKLIVEVLWPDGSPAHGARAFAEWKGARSAFEDAPKQSHQVALPLALGREYEIRADWISDLTGRHLYVASPTATTLLFRADGQRFTVTLKEKPR